MVNKIEALVDAIGKLHGTSNPDSHCYQIRNPLKMRSFARAGKHEVDDDGQRVFASWLAGYKAAIYDMDLKVRGQSRAGLKTEDRVRNLLGVYGISEIAAIDNVVSFLRRALKDPTITKETPLVYFIEGSE